MLQDFEQAYLVELVHKGVGRLLPVRRGHPFSKSLKKFQTEPPVHPSFLGVTPHKFYIV